MHLSTIMADSSDELLLLQLKGNLLHSQALSLCVWLYWQQGAKTWTLFAGGNTVLSTGLVCCNVTQSKSSTERARLFHLPYFRHLKPRLITSWKCPYLSMDVQSVLDNSYIHKWGEKNPSSAIAFSYCGQLLWTFHLSMYISAITTNHYNSYNKGTTIPPNE